MAIHKLLSLYGGILGGILNELYIILHKLRRNMLSIRVIFLNTMHCAKSVIIIILNELK